MTDDDAIALAKAYFTALDAHDATALADTLTEDAVLTIETHGVSYEGRAAIVELFSDRWWGPIHAVHHDFTHTPGTRHGRIASQFTVTYSGPGAPMPKSNANVFTIADGRISRIQVYMSGQNTIRN